MNKILKIRRIIFIFFSVLFIAGAIFVAFYSNGWRFNFNTFRFQKTGAIFIETKPKNVLIEINGKTFPDQSGPLTSGTLIRNLLPETYQINIKKAGFRPWSKNLKVEPGLVTEALNVVLIPEKIETKLFFNNESVSDFWISPKEKIVFEKENKLYFYDANFSKPIKLKGDKFLGFNSDESKILLQDSKSSIFYISDLKNNFSTLNLNLLIKNLDPKITIKNIAFHPFNSNKLILETKNELIIFDLDTKAIETISNKSVIAWLINGSNVYLWDGKVFEIFNLTLKTKNSIEDQNLTNLLSKQKLFKISPDGKKILFLEKDNKIKVYFLKDQIKALNKKAGEIISLNLSSQLTIEDVEWYFDSFHIFIVYPKEIYFTEIDNREPINQYLIDSNFLKCSYEIPTNTLYLLKDNSIYKWEIKQ